jgi:hypothetical protein
MNMYIKMAQLQTFIKDLGRSDKKWAELSLRLVIKELKGHIDDIFKHVRITLRISSDSSLKSPTAPY